ncbi:MAG: hypothetical protein WC080_04350 [Patescibacteria group bacterium]|jgi:hypothetical protein
MKWKLPPKIKIYEALGSIADNRVHINGNSAKVYSSDGLKYYDVVYNPDSHSIMSNDNGSYWQGYLGYPSIAFLMLSSVIKYDETEAEAFRDIEWKKINTKFKNDFDKTIEFIFSQKITDKNIQQKISADANKILSDIENLDLNLLGKRAKPPATK